MFRPGLFLLFAALLSGVLNAQSVQSIVVDSSDDRQYAFLDPLLQDTEVLSLAESIHLTREFPLVRLGMLRRAHRYSGYDLLAFEGSPEDIWVSQDAFLQNPSNLLDSTSGLFRIWNTAEMREVFAYERSTWATDRPLYITAYDIQPGTGNDFQGVHVFALLEDRLKRYAEAPAGLRISELPSDLAPLASSCSVYKATEDTAIEHGIAELERWITVAGPRVASAYPQLPMHVEALRLIPQNLRASLALCRLIGSAEDGRRDWSKYKRTRDLLASRYILALKAVAPQRKLALWAHVSHLFYDSSQQNTSVGELLHRELGTRLYTVGVFAAGGGTITIFSDVNEDVGYQFIHGTSSIILDYLNSKCPDACFVGLRNVTPSSPFAQPQRVWFESKTVNMNLSREFDGAVWVRHVHTPTLRLPLTLVMSLKHYLKPTATFIGILFFSLVLWLTLHRYSRLKKR